MFGREIFPILSSPAAGRASHEIRYKSPRPPPWSPRRTYVWRLTSRANSPVATTTVLRTGPLVGFRQSDGRWPSDELGVYSGSTLACCGVLMFQRIGSCTPRGGGFAFGEESFFLSFWVATVVAHATRARRSLSMSVVGIVTFSRHGSTSGVRSWFTGTCSPTGTARHRSQR